MRGLSRGILRLEVSAKVPEPLVDSHETTTRSLVPGHDRAGGGIMQPGGRIDLDVQSLLFQPRAA